MTKDVVMNNKAFRKNCARYGLDWRNFDVFNFNGDYVIVIEVPNKYIYVLFDKNFNVIGVEHWDIISNDAEKKEFCKFFYRAYCNPFSDEFYRTRYQYKPLPFPFEHLTLKQIMDISNRVSFIGYKEPDRLLGYLRLTVNYDIVHGKDDRNYISLLAYMKFLGEEIQRYYLNAYRMKILGLEYPNLYDYIQSIIINIDRAIDISIKNDCTRVPSYIYIMESLALDRRLTDEDEALIKSIIDLLIEKRGYKEKEGIMSCGEIETTEGNPADLSSLSINLLNILDLSDEEFSRKRKENYMEVDIDLKQWIEGKEKPKVPVHKR